MANKIQYIPVDINKNLEKCIEFRKDAWVISHGSDVKFSRDETIKWFNKISNDDSHYFIHVCKENKIIGQLEFKSGIEISENKVGGYINLFYLCPEFRGVGLGQIIHDYVIQQLKSRQCVEAILRYIPGNSRAERFYMKNGWFKSGEVNSLRGQAMRKYFTLS